MSQESRCTTIPSDDEEIPSMLALVTQANKVLLRMRKHAETCACCKETLEG